MKRVWLIAALALVVGLGLWGARTWAGQQQEAAGAAGAQATPTAGENVIWASGKLVPARWAGLSPAANGTVAAVRVAEGDQVERSAVLLELDNAAVQRQVEAAAAALGE